MKIRRLLLHCTVFLAMGLVSGCATTAGYEAVLQTWVGDSTDHLVSVWGIPQQQWKSPSGVEVYQYSRSGNIVIPGMTTNRPVTTYTNGTVSGYDNSGGYANASYNGTSTTYVQETAPPTVISTSCVTRFTIDPQGSITSWAWQGNSCTAVPPKGPREQQQPVYRPQATTASNNARCAAARNLCADGNSNCATYKRDFEAEGLACPGVNHPPSKN